MGGESQFLCECGFVATRSVWVRQFTAGGKVVTARLQVCDDCYDLIMETDPGASAAPLPREQQRALSV